MGRCRKSDEKVTSSSGNQVWKNTNLHRKSKNQKIALFQIHFRTGYFLENFSCGRQICVFSISKSFFLHFQNFVRIKSVTTHFLQGYFCKNWWHSLCWLLGMSIVTDFGKIKRTYHLPFQDCIKIPCWKGKVPPTKIFTGVTISFSP